MMSVFANNRLFVYEKNKFLYHFLLVISFVGSVLLLPVLMKWGATYFENDVINTVLVYAAGYLLAIYVFPGILFMFVKFNSKAEIQSR